MPLCPKCGKEISDGDSFCKSCGTRLTGLPDDQAKTESTTEDAVENVVVRRLDGIKNRDEAAVRALVDERYSKFDDWPPFARQEAKEALENEFGAFKVLSDYNYQLENFEANIFGDIAVATFHIHYQGTIRNKPFEVTSRVTSILRKEDSGWKMVHEHFSRFPETAQQQLTAGPSSQSPQSTSTTSPPQTQDRTRRYAIVGFISAVVGLFMLPEIFGSVAIVLGAYVWRRERGNLGIMLVIVGIICMIVGIEVTTFV